MCTIFVGGDNNLVNLIPPVLTHRYGVLIEKLGPIGDEFLGDIPIDNDGVMDIFGLEEIILI
jgi:hypothetical protein